MNQTELIELLKSIPSEVLAKITGRSLLSNTAILRHLEKGNIVIDPFNRENLKDNSYDVTLGQYFYREQPPTLGKRIFNPYSEKDVAAIWGKHCLAEPARFLIENCGLQENINPDDLIVLINPGETILAHTVEFIGGRNGIITTMMKARSGVGRCFTEACKCAGWGDVGYFNRWTMEITNNSRHYAIPWMVGTRIAQLAFFEVEKVLDLAAGYASKGKYQTESDISKLKASWRPEAMLPRMYADREIKKRVSNK